MEEPRQRPREGTMSTSKTLTQSQSASSTAPTDSQDRVLQKSPTVSQTRSTPSLDSELRTFSTCNNAACASKEGTYITSTDLEANHPGGKHTSQNDNNPATAAPWKYVGYRIFSRWVAFDNAFLIFRRSGTLNARIALSMQDDFVQLETQLNDLDEALADEDLPDNINNGSFRKDQFKVRERLVKKELPPKLMEYNAFMNGYTQLLNRPKIHKNDLTSVHKWLHSNKLAIDRKEVVYILQDDDLIGIQPKARFCLR